jgi:hemerythrin-like domain-containing protein
VREGEPHRLIAWDRELAVAHQRLRQALRVARDALDTGEALDTVGIQSARADLTLFCHGFCAALGGHHGSEDAALFPRLSAHYPALRPTIVKLRQDHELIASLLTQFDQAVSSDAAPAGLSLQLDGLAAIMESHFRYEERQIARPPVGVRARRRPAHGPGTAVTCVQR